MAQRLVYRRPAQWLQVQTVGPGLPGGTRSAAVAGQCTPGQQIALPLRVTDEKAGPRRPNCRSPWSRSSLGHGGARLRPTECLPRQAAIDSDRLPSHQRAGSARKSWTTPISILAQTERRLSLRETMRKRCLSLRERMRRHLACRRRWRWISCWARVGGAHWRSWQRPAKLRRRNWPGGGPWGGKALRLAAPAAARPPYVHDNGGQLRAAYEKRWPIIKPAAPAPSNTLTAVSVFAGFALVLLAAMLSVLRIGSGLRIWIPTLTAAACCLMLGTILMDPGRAAPGYGTAVAFASNDAAGQGDCPRQPRQALAGRRMRRRPTTAGRGTGSRRTGRPCGRTIDVPGRAGGHAEEAAEAGKPAANRALTDRGAAAGQPAAKPQMPEPAAADKAAGEKSGNAVANSARGKLGWYAGARTGGKCLSAKQKVAGPAERRMPTGASSRSAPAT